MTRQQNGGGNRREQGPPDHGDHGDYGDLPDQPRGRTQTAKRSPVRQAEPPAPTPPARTPRGPHPEAEYAEQPAATGLITAEPGSAGELASASQRSSAMAEVQAAVLMAHRFPRNEDDAHGRLMKSCLRQSFQESARYKYPRGKTESGATNYVSGPSVHLAREAARCWTNIRYGFYVVFEDDKRVQLRGYCWDLETGLKVEQDAAFGKLVYRKNQGWIKPDERELRELVNKHGAIAERNCVLKAMPPWLIEDAEEACVSNLRQKIIDSLDDQKRDIIAAFARFSILASMIEEDYLGHPMSEITADEIADLRQVYTAIRDGQARWSEFIAERAGTADAAADSTAGKASGTSKVTADDLLRRAADAEQRGPTPAELEAEYKRKLAELEQREKELQGRRQDPSEAERQRQIAGDVPTRRPESPPIGTTTEAERTPPAVTSHAPAAPAAGPTEQERADVARVLSQRPSGLARMDWYGERVKGMPLHLLGLLGDAITEDRSLTDDDVAFLDEMIDARRQAGR